MEGEAGSEGQRSYWDRLTLRLQNFRASVGDPSYGEIARRITARREAAGMSPHAARCARTTVYDAFRVGRARVNLDLYREIAHALGADDHQVDEWLRTCRLPMEDPPQGQGISGEAPPSAPGRQVVVLMLSCVALNFVGRVIVDLLHLPAYLDMVGTAVAALALGPWRGAVVGGATNVLASLASGLVSLPFAVVNIAGALVWGYGARRFGWGRTLPRFFALNVLVALVCSLIAVPILVLLFDGSVEQGQDTVTATFMELTHVLTVSVGFANILTSLGDKLISGFVALVVLSALPLALRAHSPLLFLQDSQSRRSPGHPPAAS